MQVVALFIGLGPLWQCSVLSVALVVRKRLGQTPGRRSTRTSAAMAVVPSGTLSGVSASKRWRVLGPLYHPQDGTLVVTKSGNQFPSSKDDWKWFNQKVGKRGRALTLGQVCALGLGGVPNGGLGCGWRLWV